MRQALAFVFVACSLAGCSGDGSGPRDGSIPLWDGGPDGAVPPGADEDQDGLCDATEEEAGSSLDNPDTDGDGLPDLVELIYGFGTTDPLSPAEDEVAFLDARPGAESRFALRFTVDGSGGDYSGFFEDIPAPYDDGTSAGTYLISSQAISSEPPEAARVVEGPKQRFRSVLGSARLELDVLFRANNDVSPESCSRAYPFRYGLREDSVGLVDDHVYLLIVAPPESRPEDYCQPASCL